MSGWFWNVCLVILFRSFKKNFKNENEKETRAFQPRQCRMCLSFLGDLITVNFLSAEKFNLICAVVLFEHLFTVDASRAHFANL